MFSSKKNPTLEIKKGKTSGTSTFNMNPFVNVGLTKAAQVLSGNGSLQYSELIDSEIATQFAKTGEWKKARSYEDVSTDMSALWAEDPLNAVKFTIYLRMVTRDIQDDEGNSIGKHSGAELRNEGLMRMLWLHVNHKDVFWKNFKLYVLAGGWRDVFAMLCMDLEYHGWEGRVLDWKRFSTLIQSGLSNENQSELVKKWMPSINNKTNTNSSVAKNMVAKWLCSELFGKKEDGATPGSTYAQYRRLKSSGNAHSWQQKISRKEFANFDFDSVHGLALRNMYRSKFLDNQGLRSAYDAWATKPETQEKGMKYTGFVHELFQNFNMSNAPSINAQFKTLVDKVREENVDMKKLIVVRDTSGSMSAKAEGTDMSCGNVAKAIALFFSEFLKGDFKNTWVEFHSTAKMRQWKGSTPCEKWVNDNSNYVGSTNFQSVIDLFCDIKRRGVSEEDFPEGINCISDGNFNPSSLNRTNVEDARRKLLAAGFSKEYVRNFVIVLWDLRNGFYGKDKSRQFETAIAGQPNVFYFGGYSASVIKFLTGKIANQEELVNAALTQPLLERVKL